MAASNSEPQQSGLELNDILFVLFKHKRTVLLSSAFGLAAAAAVYFFHPPIYQSDAKLLVRYVIDRSAVDPIESMVGSPQESATNAIGSEVELLTSWDLALEVAETVGVERLVPKSENPPDKTDAAASILSRLTVTALKGSNVITASYKDRDPILARTVLEEIVNRYFDKHLDVHRSAGAFEFVRQQRDNIRGQLNQTEERLRNEKAKAKIVSLPESTTALTTELARIEGELNDAETERAGQKARLKELESSLPTGSSSGSVSSPDATRDVRFKAPEREVQRYQALVARLTRLRQTELDLLSRFTGESRLVKMNKAEIETLEGQRHELEERFPDLAATSQLDGSTGRLEIVAERARLAALDARVENLRARYTEIEERAKQLLDVGPLIADLELKKGIDENTYKHFAERLEKASIDEALDPSKIPNISFVQRPSPAMRVVADLKKLVLGLAGGGVAGGIAFALLVELLLNRTIKRPFELESRFGIPLMLSIPYVPSFERAAARQLALTNKSNGPATQKQDPKVTSAWDSDHFLRPYAEAVRDRLVLYFELSRLTRKPKLVAVTGLSKGVGVSSIAGGLAAALSETGEGKVLLVDMNVERTEVHPFFKGRAAYPLTEALHPQHPISPAGDNLYLATAAESGPGPMRLVPKRFYELLPHLKASDFDYIIFDMLPLSECSATLAIAGFMDKVLLVLEAEANNRDTVRRAYDELSATKASVSGIFNKARTYSPKWFKTDL